MTNNVLEVPGILGGAQISVSLDRPHRYAFAVTRIDQPKRLFVCKYLDDKADAASLPPTARALAEEREQSVHIFALTEHDKWARWIGTFHADGTATT